MRCWQVAGGSVSGERVGWKLLHLDEASGGFIRDQSSLAPRRGYNPRDPVIHIFDCRV
jgi:hypothetical protein